MKLFAFITFTIFISSTSFGAFNDFCYFEVKAGWQTHHYIGYLQKTQKTATDAYANYIGFHLRLSPKLIAGIEFDLSEDPHDDYIFRSSGLIFEGRYFFRKNLSGFFIKAGIGTTLKYNTGYYQASSGSIYRLGFGHTLLSKPESGLSKLMLGLDLSWKTFRYTDKDSSILFPGDTTINSFNAEMFIWCLYIGIMF